MKAPFPVPPSPTRARLNSGMVVVMVVVVVADAVRASFFMVVMVCVAIERGSDQTAGSGSRISETLLHPHAWSTAPTLHIASSLEKRPPLTNVM